uniref:LTD domain-containing protein n=1 Tax=Caenorhabditis tropicalis TaxID=1561998 RepID=A0A1I7V419_9PELO
MVDEEEEDLNVRYWKTKYELLHEDYKQTKQRAENLENRLLDIVEESERKQEKSEETIGDLERKLEESGRRIEQLKAACFRYKNQTRGVPDKPPELEPPAQKIRTVRTTSGESVNSRSSIDGITRSPEFHAGEHLICEYHQLPVLAKGEGFIYGFRWTTENKIHIV